MPGILQKIHETLYDFNMYSVTFRILLAALIGGFIGSERGRHGRAAGLRTHVLVCLGSTMTVMVGLYSALELGFSGDPMRIGAQVISGIGFLGAGTILTKNRSEVTGLTTSAGLWTTASLGLAIGVGFYWAVIVGFIVVVVTISVLTRLERSVKRQIADKYYVELDNSYCVNDFYERAGEFIADLQVIPAKSGLDVHVGTICTLTEEADAAEVVEKIKKLNYVVFAVPAIR